MLHTTDRPCPRSLAGAALATVLLVASACAGSSAPSTLPVAAEATDAAGDVWDSYEHTPIEAPDYVDVRHMSAGVDGADLVLTLDLAGDLPQALNASQTTVVVGFGLDMEGEADFLVKIRSQDGWRPTLSSLVPFKLGATSDFPGSAEIVAGRLTVRLPRAAVGDPGVFQLRAAVAYEDYPNPDPLIGVSASDGVPDLGEAGLEVRLD